MMNSKVLNISGVLTVTINVHKCLESAFLGCTIEVY